MEKMKTLDIVFELYEHYGKVEEIQHYYGLLALYGLVQAAYEKADEVSVERCRGLLDRYPDKINHPYYNFPCYMVGGNASAWACMKGIHERSREELVSFAEKTMAGPKEAQGILCMPGGEKEGKIWIDVATAVTPYMLFTGLVCGKEEYIDFAADQCFKMYETLLDSSCSLLHQCRGFREDCSLFSEDHWSRGNGWGYLALAELVQYLPTESVHRVKAEQYYQDLSKALLPYQTKKGLWCQEITEISSWEESSGTALLLYGIGVGLRAGLLEKEPYENVFLKGMNGLLQYGMNRDFSTELSCPGCLCPGEGADKGTIKAYITEKQPIKDEHHSFGAFMLALVEAHRNGYAEVDWKGRKLWKA